MNTGTLAAVWMSSLVAPSSSRVAKCHLPWETHAFAEIKAVIDQTLSTKTAITLMARSSTMGKSGYFTPALLQQVLDYVSSENRSREPGQHQLLRIPTCHSLEPI